jgi:hypothetical protein
MRYLCTIAVSLLALLAVSPASARRRARRPAPKPAPVVAPAPAPDVARSVILFITDGYSEADWRDARAGGYLALDRLPVAGLALPPAGLESYSPATLGRVLGAGQGPEAAGTPVPLMGLARQYGKSVALVGGDTAAAPVLCGLTVGSVPEDETAAWRRLTDARVDVLFGRTLPDDAAPVLSAAGYRVSLDAASILTAEETPAAAAAPVGNVPFETLVFRALHLAAKAPKGFMLAAAAQPSGVSAQALDAAVASAVRYAERDGRTLILVADRRGDSGITLHAFGPASRKFSGVLAATDVPKILAGVTGLKVFRRDFSPLFQARSAPSAAPAERTALKPSGKGIQPLPW